MASIRGNEANRRIVSETLKLYKDLLANPLDEKQLARPAFKLIQDIVKSLITETRTLRNVFNPSDFDSENKTWDKRRKVEFVQKLIDFAANHKQPVVGCVAAKLVAGLEPNKTNELLQSLAKIALARVSGQDNNSTRTRTFTKQLPRPTTQTQKPSTGSVVAVKPDATKRTSGPQQVTDTPRGKGLPVRTTEISSIRRVSGDRLSRGTSGTSTRNVSASSVASVRKASSPSNKAVGSLKLAVGSDHESESLNSNTDRSIPDILSSSVVVVAGARKQSNVIKEPSNHSLITSESDIGKHMLQLRSSLRALGPVLLDISEFSGELKKCLMNATTENV